MKAWILEDTGRIKYTTTQSLPAINQDEVLVKVKASGICGSDIPRVYKTGAHRMPLIIGHEFSGIVEDVGKSVHKSWIGKRVGIFPLIPCKKCPACLSKKYEMCSDYSYLGSRRNGGFSEYVSVPVWNLIELPYSVTYEQAAMLEPMAVAVHAMRKYAISKDTTVAICGMGTIGQLLLMFLKEQGVDNVYALGNKEVQKKAAMELGICEKNFFDMREGNINEWIAANTLNRGVDIYFECVGKSELVTLGTQITCAGGNVCLVGNPGSDIVLEKNEYWKILRKQLIFTGSWNSSFLGCDDECLENDDWNYALKKLKSGAIKPEKIITHRFDIEKLDSGLELMRDKSEEYIKVMVVE